MPEVAVNSLIENLYLSDQKGTYIHTGLRVHRNNFNMHFNANSSFSRIAHNELSAEVVLESFSFTQRRATAAPRPTYGKGQLIYFRKH